jgi:hypothetical protein
MPNQRWMSLSLGGLILAGVFVDRTVFQVPAANADAYHARVRQTVMAIPMEIGGWHGEDTPVPQSAQRLLRSNVVVSRRYGREKDSIKEYFSFLLVQCGDARDLLGHYPPNCYPATGYTLVSQERHDWPVDNLLAHGTTYQFTQDTLHGAKAIRVYDFMVLPDGETSPNLEGVYRVARNRRMRYYGAAQIQIITDVDMIEADRAEVINSMLDGAKAAINAIQSGVTK